MNHSRDSEECSNCIFFNCKSRCEKCVRNYTSLPDSYISASDFFEEISTDKKSNYIDQWPDNLYCTVFEISVEEYNVRPRHLKQNADDVLRLLSDTQSRVIRMRYKDSLSLTVIGRKINLSAERIRQLITSAVRKLKCPENKQVFKYGIEYSDYKLYELSRVNSSNSQLSSQYRFNDISELNLTQRVENVLRQSGVNTIGQLVLYTDTELAVIRGLGKKSICEIHDALDKKNVKINQKS